MISWNPPTTPLPADVLNLMHLTVELVHLLYWNPVPTKGSPGEVVFVERMRRCQKYPLKRKSSDTSENSEGGIVEDKKMGKLTRSQPNFGHERKFDLPADMDLEARKEYGRALMSGPGHGMLSSLSSSHCL